MQVLLPFSPPRYVAFTTFLSTQNYTKNHRAGKANEKRFLLTVCALFVSGRGIEFLLPASHPDVMSRAVIPTRCSNRTSTHCRHRRRFAKTLFGPTQEEAGNVLQRIWRKSLQAAV
jgi:hypothetical protein